MLGKSLPPPSFRSCERPGPAHVNQIVWEQLLHLPRPDGSQPGTVPGPPRKSERAHVQAVPLLVRKVGRQYPRRSHSRSDDPDTGRGANLAVRQGFAVCQVQPHLHRFTGYTIFRAREPKHHPEFATGIIEADQTSGGRSRHIDFRNDD